MRRLLKTVMQHSMLTLITWKLYLGELIQIPSWRGGRMLCEIMRDWKGSYLVMLMLQDLISMLKCLSRSSLVNIHFPSGLGAKLRILPAMINCESLSHIQLKYPKINVIRRCSSAVQFNVEWAIKANNFSCGASLQEESYCKLPQGGRSSQWILGKSWVSGICSNVQDLQKWLQGEGVTRSQSRNSGACCQPF